MVLVQLMTHRRFESDYTPQILNIMEYSDDFIRELFNSSHSQKEVLEKIGRKPNGSGWRTICKMAKQINLDLKEYNVRNNKDKYDLNPNFCKCCGKKIEYEKRHNIYCSHSCSAIVNNRLRTKEKKMFKLW